MNDVTKSLIAGVVGTAVMTAMMMIAGLMGMPKMSPPDMLAGGMGVSVIIGWVMHFMIGIVFAVIYVYVIAGMLKKVDSHLLKGVIFGIIAFVMAQVAMMLMKQMMDMPEPEGSMMVLALLSLMGHIVFGIVVAMIAKK